jgi:5-methylcytosine-specific restriction endonuclease McrA
MGRTRKQDTHLPQRLFFRHGAYYYVSKVEDEFVWHPMGKDAEFAIEQATKLNKASRKDRIAIVGALRTASELVKNSIFQRDGFKCVYCGSTEDLGLDHVIPFCSGGSSKQFNLVACCVNCNWSKGDKDPREFIFEIMGIRELIVSEVLKILDASTGIGNRQERSKTISKATY